ncbi:MAG: GAF domain-containing protein [Vicinamibacterales bacterium]
MFKRDADDGPESLALLRDIGTRFLRADDVETVAREVFDVLSKKLRLGVYINYLLADDGQSLRLSSCAGIEDQEVVRSLAVLMPGQAICGTVAVTGRRIVAENIQASHETMFSLVKSLGLTAYACHPLLAGERLIGTLSFGSRSRERFTGAELELMQTVATFAAIAIDRATIAERQRRTQMLLTRAREDERRRIARELHDEMAQNLTGFSLVLKSLDGLVQPRAVPTIQELQRLVDRVGRDVHRIARELRPSALDDLGLELALTTYAEEWSQRGGIPVDVHVSGLKERAPEMVETALYRIVQEAFTNIAKHAKATRVSLVVRAADQQLQAVIEDDGVGFARLAGAASEGDRDVGLGLAGMEERASLLGGSLAIESSSGMGTAVYVRLPLGRKPYSAPEIDS